MGPSALPGGLAGADEAQGGVLFVLDLEALVGSEDLICVEDLVGFFFAAS